MEAPFTADFFKRLQQLRIHTRRAFLGARQGTHLSPKKGHGLEFSDYRLYSAGDDFRHIDWGVYGKTDRLYVRQFREEQDLNVSILIDGSASMGEPFQKFELTTNLALALGFVALSDGDSVNLSVLGSSSSSPTYSSPRALSKAYKYLKTKSPTEDFDMKQEVSRALSKLKAPGKCFVISDFLGDLNPLMDGLRIPLSKNFELAIVQILSPTELNLSGLEEDALLVDSESGEKLQLSIGAETKRAYAKALAEHIETIESFCKKTGIAYALVSSEDSIKSVVLEKLVKQGFIS